MNVEIVTPERVLYAGEADMLIARGTQGEVGILDNHEPFVLALDYGELRLYHGDTVGERFAVFGGFLEVRDNVVSVLSDDAAAAGEIEVDAAAVDLERLRAQKPDADDAAGLDELHRAEVRFAVAPPR